jgi:hypothetical protein
MRLCFSQAVLFCVLAMATHAEETLDAFGHRWSVPFAADWSVEKQAGVDILRLKVPRPQTQPRRPIQFAIASDTPDFQTVALEAEVRREKTSLILVYAYKDEAHFNYAHLSVDAASKQPVHNGIFHVYGGERVRISGTQGPGALPSDAEWYGVRLVYNSSTGLAEVFVNGDANPSLRAVDLSLGSGKVGLGSFFETGFFPERPNPRLASQIVRNSI